MHAFESSIIDTRLVLSTLCMYAIVSIYLSHRNAALLQRAVIINWPGVEREGLEREGVKGLFFVLA